MTEACPGCGDTRSRAMSSGLGGRWKVICAICGWRFAEGNGDEDYIDPTWVIDEKE